MSVKEEESKSSFTLQKIQTPPKESVEPEVKSPDNNSEIISHKEEEEEEEEDGRFMKKEPFIANHEFKLFNFEISEIRALAE